MVTWLAQTHEKSWPIHLGARFVDFCQSASGWPVKEHDCRKNWDKLSKAVESEMAIEVMKVGKGCCRKINMNAGIYKIAFFMNIILIWYIFYTYKIMIGIK